MTPKEAKLLEWVKRVPDGVLEQQIIGSGLSKALDGLLRAGLVEMAAHPTVKDGGAPAATVIYWLSADGHRRPVVKDGEAK